jgi:S-DNA-T family DNA segregation ATPase FtsK/SpoIIIE
VKGSTVSRRVSEFVGVALFAAALIWIVALATYSPDDPVWFFSTGPSAAPANFAGRVGAFLAELSFQLVGYAAYMVPALLVLIGWHYFWCRRLDAAGTKATGAGLLLAGISAFLSLVVHGTDTSGRGLRPGGYAGEWLARELSEYLNRTGSVIVVLTLIALSTIISTQLSFGRLFVGIVRTVTQGGARALAAFREWREERRREKQRRDVIAKHTKKGTEIKGRPPPHRPPKMRPEPR